PPPNGLQNAKSWIISREICHCPPIVIGRRRGVAARKKSVVLALSAYPVMAYQDRRPPLHRINTDHSRLISPALFGVTYREFPHVGLSGDRESWDDRESADGCAVRHGGLRRLPVPAAFRLPQRLRRIPG